MKSPYAVAWVLAYISIASVSSAIITPALPYIENEYNLTPGAVEWIVSAFLSGYVFGLLAYGPLANAYGRLKALRLGLSINLLGLLLCLVAVNYESYLMLVSGRFITGLGAASGLTCSYMLINEWLPKDTRKTAMAYAVLSFALGIGLAVMIGGIITQYWHWQGCFWLLLAQGLVMLWGTKAFSETLTEPKPIQIKTLLSDFIQAFLSRQLFVFSMLVGTCSIINYCFSAAGPQIAHDYLKITVAEYGYWNGINIIGMLIGGLSARELLARFTLYRVLGIGFSGCVLAVCSLLIFWWNESHSVAWFFISTASLYVFSSYLFAAGSYMASNAIEDKASASSMMSFINMGSATLGVIIMGYLSHNALQAFISILVSVLVLMFVLLYSFHFLRKEEG